jgi:DNA-binding beta-propeller fold protein YncE
VHGEWVWLDEGDLMSRGRLPTVGAMVLLLLLDGCRTTGRPGGAGGAAGPPEGVGAGAIADASGPQGTAAGGHLPLVPVADVPLPGGATRLDYQDIDRGRGHLVIAHMNDNSVLILDLRDGSVVKELKGISTARGIAVADEVGRIFVTSSPNQLVIIDNASLTEIGRVTTGGAPDGVGWDPIHNTVGVSDQRDGALSLIANAGGGARTAVALGTETGNVVFDSTRGWFWITVVTTSSPDQLVAVAPVDAKVKTRVNLPGCSGAHGLRLHPDARSAFIACEDNGVLARVDLVTGRLVGTAPTGDGPDVLSIDPGLGWLYVAAESGDLTIFDIAKPGVILVGHDHPGPNAHTVSADPTSHRVFFPLMAGPGGKPILRIMRPSGT